jgi:hypothetical protein
MGVGTDEERLHKQGIQCDISPYPSFGLGHGGTINQD